ncbi:MAG: redoxin domain-containing protein [Gammaproteobacteria bacterium]|nr:redoxin domain-containing protein [Gammaproteobacteria bacterium]
MDLGGKPERLADYTGKGKWTVVMFWAADCRVCNAEMGHYIQFGQDHQDKVSMLGISLDGQAGLDAARAFIKRHAVPFPNLVGEPVTVATLYQTLTHHTWVGTPSFLVYNPKGELIGAQEGAIPPALIVKFINDNTPPASPPK